MRRVTVLTSLLALGLLLSNGGPVAAQNQVMPYSGVAWDESPGPGGPDVPVPGTTYNVYTGVASATNTLFLIEASPPVRDDVVPFDLLPDQINDYVAAAGSVQRTVTETVTVNPDGTQTSSFRVTGTTPAGGPGDLWPSGFTGGTPSAPLTNGGFGLGLNLPANLGGADPVNFVGSTILSANFVITRSGVDQPPITIPLSFFAPSPANWDGVIGIGITNGATGATIENALTLNITSIIPEPASLGLASLASVGLLRRRRSGSR